MSIIVNLVSAIIKSVIGDKINNTLTKEIIGISIDQISEETINKINDFINKETSKINYILSEDNMKSIGISQDNMDYITAEIKDLLLETKITNEVLRQCKYDCTNLSIFLWDKYRSNKKGYIECESNIRSYLLTIAGALIELEIESENFENDVLIHISNYIDDTNLAIQKISEYMEESFRKLDINDKMVLDILWMTLEQIQKMNIQNNNMNIPIIDKKLQNNKKIDYITIWNSNLFLHQDNDHNPITLAETFIMPNYTIHKEIRRIGFSSSDTLDKIIFKFINYKKTSTMFIIGVPGIGKTSIISWIANRYKDDNNVIILRFRDWGREELESGLLKAICNTLACKKRDLENTVLVLDGLDEIKALDIRDPLFKDFFNELLDWNNLKIIITSRPNYIDFSSFQNVFELLPFDLNKAKQFCQIVNGNESNFQKINSKNLKILGIPVILYMAIMSNVTLNSNTTKPEIYAYIFSETGGIFDKFYYDGIGYDEGAQVFRNLENAKKYLKFLQEIAFIMFDTNTYSLPKEKYTSPSLEFERKKINILEFPIKYLFEKENTNIEFLHNSIYEYFVADYLFVYMRKGINSSKEDFAGILGNLLKSQKLSFEILDFLKYKVERSELNNKFELVKDTFELMLHNGMTYYTGKCYKNVIDCEMLVFANMLEIVHIWENIYDNFEITNMTKKYLKYCYDFGLNLARINMSKLDLENIYLVKANLKLAKLELANLSNGNLKMAYLRGANLKGAHLRNTDLKYAYFREADLRSANLTEVELEGANLTDTIFDESQIHLLIKHSGLKNIKVYVHKTKEILSYENYIESKTGSSFH